MSTQQTKQKQEAKPVRRELPAVRRPPLMWNIGADLLNQREHPDEERQ